MAATIPPPLFWDCNPDIQDVFGNTVAMNLAKNGIISVESK